eukprot:COSAG02_NODE_2312_length_9165_cov_13.956872_12_plen_109_part_00
MCRLSHQKMSFHRSPLAHSGTDARVGLTSVERCVGHRLALSIRTRLSNVLVFLTYPSNRRTHPNNNVSIIAFVVHSILDVSAIIVTYWFDIPIRSESYSLLSNCVEIV